VNYGTYGPAIDEFYFQGIFDSTGEVYWSSTIQASPPEHERDPELAWYVYFYNGQVWANRPTDLEDYVLCVRGDVALRSFTDNGNKTVTDNLTGLMWQQEHNDVLQTWEEALQHCENLTVAGYQDWRLPDIKELRSIVDNTKCMPAIDENFFPGVPASGGAWSSTTNPFWGKDSPYLAWHLNYYAGQASGLGGKTMDTKHVRCVRSTGN